MKDLKLSILVEGFDKATKPFKNILKSSGNLQTSLGKTAGELKALNVTQSKLTGFKTLKRETGETTRALAQAQRQAQQLGQAFAKADKPTRAMTKAARDAAKQVQSLKVKQLEQRRELQSSRNEMKRSGINTRKLGLEQGKVARKINETNRQLENQQRALKRSAQLQNRLRQAGERYRKTLQTQSNVGLVGAAGLATGGTALRGLTGALVPGIGFDEQMSAVGGIARIGKDSEAFANLRNQALELGATTSFSASEAAGGMEFLAMAGFKPEEITGTMPGLLDLAKAGRTDLAETADIASNILTTFDLAPSQMGELGDALVGTFTRSNVDLRMLGETMKYVGPIANEAGASFQEAAAMAGLLGNAGIQASDAGTAMRSVYTRLPAPPKTAADALHKLGIDARDTSGNLRAVPEILADVAKATEGLGTAERLGLFKAIAGERAGGAFAKLVGASGAGTITKFIEVLGLAEGEARALALAMGDNAAGDLKNLTSAWEGLNIAISDTQTGPLRSLIQGATSVLRTITSWARENPKLAGTLFTVATALATVWAGVGALALLVAGILGPFAVMNFALTAIGLKGLALLPIFVKLGTAILAVGKLILLGIGAVSLPVLGLVAAFAGVAALIWYYWEPLSGYFSKLWTELTSGWGSALRAIAKLFADFSPIGILYTIFAEVLNWFGADLPRSFFDAGQALMTGLVEGIKSYLPDVTAAISSLANVLPGNFSAMLGIQSPSRVFATLGGFVTQGLTQGIKGGQNKAVEAVSQLGRALPRAAAAGALGTTIATVPAYAGTASGTAPTGGDRIEIHVHGHPGMDEHALARAVARELEAREREQAARRRSRLID